MRSTSLVLGPRKALIHCALAETSDEHITGLQRHASLSEDEGMLFAFDPPRGATFWMGKVAFPIDIIGIDSNMRVTRVVEAAQPKSLDRWTFPKVAFVLETPAGWARRNAITRGAQVAEADPVSELSSRQAGYTEDDGWLLPDGSFQEVKGTYHAEWLMSHGQEYGLRPGRSMNALFKEAMNSGWIRVTTYGIELIPKTLETRYAEVKRLLSALMRSHPGEKSIDMPRASLRVDMTPTGRPDFTNLDELVQSGDLAYSASRQAQLQDEESVQARQLHERDDDPNAVDQYNDRQMPDDIAKELNWGNEDNFQWTWGRDFVDEPGMDPDHVQEPGRYHASLNREAMPMMKELPAGWTWRTKAGKTPRPWIAIDAMTDKDKTAGEIYLVRLDGHKDTWTIKFAESWTPNLGPLLYEKAMEVIGPDKWLQRDTSISPYAAKVHERFRSRIEDEGDDSLEMDKALGPDPRFNEIEPNFDRKRLQVDLKQSPVHVFPGTGFRYRRRAAFEQVEREIPSSGYNILRKLCDDEDIKRVVGEYVDATKRASQAPSQENVDKAQSYTRIQLVPGLTKAAQVRTAQIVDEAKFVQKVAEVIAGNIGNIQWIPDRLNGGQSERTVVTRRTLAKWLGQSAVEDEGIRHILDAASTEQGLSLIGDAFIMLGEADTASTGFKDGESGLVLRRSMGGGN